MLEAASSSPACESSFFKDIAARSSCDVLSDDDDDDEAAFFAKILLRLGTGGAATISAGAFVSL